MSISVLIADDQPLMRAALRTCLGAEPDITVVGEASDGAAAVRLTEQLRPAVVVMDVRMPILDGIEATRRVVGLPGEPPTRVLVMTTFDLDEHIIDAVRAGASGFLVKDARSDQILDGIRAVAAGEALASPSVTRRLIERFVDAPGPPPQPSPRLRELTPRERDVLELIARGLSNTELAERLYLSEKTVKTHVGRILSKLGVRDRVQAVILAYEAGIVVPGRQ